MTYGKKYLEKKYNTSLNELKKFPKYFLIETINTCNARCIMCGIDFDKKRAQLMTDSLFKKILDEISENVDYVEKVQIYYDCEPLIDKKLHLKIKDLKNIGVKTTNIATNASILFPKRSQELIEANLDEIYITIDSMKKEIFDHIKPGFDLEKEIFGNLAKDKQIAAFKHNGFWKSMNTLKDVMELNELYNKGNTPWIK